MVLKRMIVIFVFLLLNCEGYIIAQVFHENSEYVVIEDSIMVWKYGKPTIIGDKYLRYGQKFTVVRFENKDTTKIVILKIRSRKGKYTDELFYHNYNNLLRAAVSVEHSGNTVDQYAKSVEARVVPYMTKYKVESEVKAENTMYDILTLMPGDYVYYRGSDEKDGQTYYYFTSPHPDKEIQQSLFLHFNWNRQNFQVDQDTLERSFKRISNGKLYDERMISFVKDTKYLSTSSFRILKTSNGKIDRQKIWDNTYCLAGPWVIIPTGAKTERDEYEVIFAPDQIKDLDKSDILSDGEKLYIAKMELKVFVAQ